MAGKLKVKIEENIILDNQDYGSKRVFEISSIANITKKIVTIAGDDDATVLVFKSTTASADSALDLQTVKYIRITNLDDTNALGVILEDTGGDVAAITVPADMSFILTSADIEANAGGSAVTTRDGAIDEIFLRADSANVQAEIVVATTE